MEATRVEYSVKYISISFNFFDYRNKSLKCTVEIVIIARIRWLVFLLQHRITVQEIQ